MNESLGYRNALRVKNLKIHTWYNVADKWQVQVDNPEVKKINK